MGCISNCREYTEGNSHTIPCECHGEGRSHPHAFYRFGIELGDRFIAIAMTQSSCDRLGYTHSIPIYFRFRNFSNAREKIWAERQKADRVSNSVSLLLNFQDIVSTLIVFFMRDQKVPKIRYIIDRR